MANGSLTFPLRFPVDFAVEVDEPRSLTFPITFGVDFAVCDGAATLSGSGSLSAEGRAIKAIKATKTPDRGGAPYPPYREPRAPVRFGRAELRGVGRLEGRPVLARDGAGVLSAVGSLYLGKPIAYNEEEELALLGVFDLEPARV